MKIKLFTRDGGFVRDGEIPPFLIPPEVITWGSRTFVHDEKFTPLHGEPTGYVEGLAYPLEAADALVARSTAAAIPVDRSARVLTDGSPVTDDHRELLPSGQQKGYVVLSAEERAKGFVRPVRATYKHVTCGSTTTMGTALAETYARDPGFYAGTFCVTCRTHKPLTEFVWMDGSRVGS